MTATFQTISSTREEYLSIIEDLKSSAPPQVKKGQKRSKLEVCHLKLIEDLEGRLEAIDAGLAVSNGSFTRVQPQRTANVSNYKSGMPLIWVSEFSD